MVKETEEQQEAPIHGDILETVLSHVPLIHLAPASHVSISWSRAVDSSLHYLNAPKPWLIVHTQTTCPPYVTTTRYYDPRSRSWFRISTSPENNIRYVAAVRSSSSNLSYMLSPSRLSFSSDALRSTWRHTDAPIVWRTDPIVSLVGDLIVVAGGTCDFEDDPIAVEIYDVSAATWRARSDGVEDSSMPSSLKDSTASSSLSITSDDRKMYVVERETSLIHSFDPIAKVWSGLFDLNRQDINTLCSAITFCQNRLIQVARTGKAEIKLYEVDRESFTCKEICEVPSCYVEKLKSGEDKNGKVESLNVCSAGDVMYLYSNAASAKEVLMCEFGGGGGGCCRWESVVVGGGWRADVRVVMSCAVVGIEDLVDGLKRGTRIVDSDEL